MKLAEVWLSNEEQSNKDCLKELDEFCAAQKRRGYKTVIFESGRGDLTSLTQELLRCNI